MKVIVGQQLKKRSNGYYYIVHNEGGKLVFKTTKCRSKRDAVLFLQNEAPENPTPQPVEANNSTPLLSALFTELEKSKRLRAQSLIGYRSAVTQLKNLVGDKRVDQYTAEDLEKLKQFHSKASDNTINTRIRGLKAVFGYAVLKGYIKTNPFSESCLIKMVKKPPVFLSQDEFQQLLKVVPSEVARDFFIVAANTGLRLNELINLSWKTVSLEKKQLVVVNGEDFSTKSGHSRTIPLNDTVLEILQRRYEKSKRREYVFSKAMGTRFAGNYMSLAFKRAVRELGLNNHYHFHTLRHSFASWLAEREVPIFSIQQLLGHSSVNTTLIYAHLSSSQLHGAVNKL